MSRLDGSAVSVIPRSFRAPRRLHLPPSGQAAALPPGSGRSPPPPAASALRSRRVGPPQTPSAGPRRFVFVAGCFLSAVCWGFARPAGGRVSFPSRPRDPALLACVPFQAPLRPRSDAWAAPAWAAAAVRFLFSRCSPFPEGCPGSGIPCLRRRRPVSRTWAAFWLPAAGPGSGSSAVAQPASFALAVGVRLPDLERCRASPLPRFSPGSGVCADVPAWALARL